MAKPRLQTDHDTAIIAIATVAHEPANTVMYRSPNRSTKVNAKTTPRQYDAKANPPIQPPAIALKSRSARIEGSRRPYANLVNP
ncbi:hypothetical protein D3C80_1680040 [compost metagenome]|jgi:hypothetical protein